MFYALLTIFAAAVAAVDQWTKVLAQQYLTGTTVTIIPDWLQLHYITNDGMALSLFRGGRWMFVALTAVYLAVVVWAIAKKHIYKKPELWCLAAVWAGGVGNAIDRVVHGYVVDMFEVEFINFAVFNVADAAVCVGAALLVIYCLVSYKKEKKEFSAIFARGRASIIIDIRGALLKKALGYDYEEEKKVGRKDKNGENIMIVEKYKRHQPPSETAAAMLLRNYDTKWIDKDNATTELKKQEFELRKTISESNNFDLDWEDKND